MPAGAAADPCETAGEDAAADVAAPVPFSLTILSRTIS